MVKDNGTLIFAAAKKNIIIDKDGLYRINYRGAKDITTVQVKSGVIVKISEKFCPRTHFNNIIYDIQDGANVEISSFTENAGLSVKHEITLNNNSVLKGFFGFIGGEILDEFFVTTKDGGEVELNLLSFLDSVQKQNHNLISRQSGLNSTINFNCRGVANGNSNLVFVTKGIIDKGSKGSIAAHRSKVLTLSDTAIAEVDPSLIIDEADVKAAHSGSVGRIGREIKYYLMSRGLNEKQVITIITQGFLSELVKGFSDQRDMGRLYRAIGRDNNEKF